MKQIIKEAAQYYNINVCNEALYKLEGFLRLVYDWRKRVNITGSKELKDILCHQLVPSIAYVSSDLIGDSQNILDFGSGAGFPGMVMGIIYNSRLLILIEANQKKASFLKHVRRELGLWNIKVLDIRAEDVERSDLPSEGVNVIIGRFAGGIDFMVECADSLLEKGGRFLVGGLSVYSVGEQIKGNTGGSYTLLFRRIFKPFSFVKPETIEVWEKCFT